MQMYKDGRGEGFGGIREVKGESGRERGRGNQGGDVYFYLPLFKPVGYLLMQGLKNSQRVIQRKNCCF